VLVVRVHPELLRRERLPACLVTRDLWEQRYASIKDLELHLTRNGVVIRKFFLHLSKAEQRRRLLSRLEEPEKNWKFSVADLRERKRWKDYQKAYEQMIRATAVPHAPWYVVPADHKWFTRLVVAQAVVDAMESLSLKPPRVDKAQRKELAAVRQALEAEA
jgi:polyphosphate kinase 2 (PPK2 family)